MSDESIVVGAAIVRDYHLFVVRRMKPSSVSGYWELPGAELAADEEEYAALQREFTSEFSVSLRCVDRILSDQRLNSWRNAADEAANATLRVWRCQLPSESTFDTDYGEPRPNMYTYDDASWVSIDDLDAVGPWREADRLLAGDIANHYHHDEIWQSAD